MITVTVTESGRSLSLRLEGHAGFAEEGQDIVCASASILAYTVAVLVLEADIRGELEAPALVRLESGDTVISCEATKDAFSSIQRAFFFATRGFMLLGQNYPQYVRLLAYT